MGVAFIIITVVLAIISLLFGTARGKGKIGEKKVVLALRLLPKEYVVLNDIMVRNRGHTAQIDHIVVSPYGIFVIETKNYLGWIYGGARSQYWTQNIYGHKYQLYNPILQNQFHIKALRRLLPKNVSNAFISIIAFTSKSRLFVKATEAEVIHVRNIVRTIKRYDSIILSDKEVGRIVSAICENRVEGNDVAQTHKQEVRNRKVAFQRAMTEGRCPRCGGILIERHGKYGSFYGCSNYPKCKFTCQRS